MLYVLFVFGCFWYVFIFTFVFWRASRHIKSYQFSCCIAKHGCVITCVFLMYFPCIFAVAHRSDGGRMDNVGQRKRADNKTFHDLWNGIITHICINLKGKPDTILHFGRGKGHSNQNCLILCISMATETTIFTHKCSCWSHVVRMLCLTGMHQQWAARDTIHQPKTCKNECS